MLVVGQTMRDYRRKGEAVPAGAAHMICRTCGLAVLITREAVDRLEEALQDGAKTGALCVSCAPEAKVRAFSMSKPNGEQVDELPEPPKNCWACGALLMGGATKHAPNCPVRLLIEKAFPPRGSDPAT